MKYHCAESPNQGPLTNSKNWVVRSKNKIYSSPVISTDSLIYIGSTDGYMYALYPNGTEKWIFKANGYYVLPNNLYFKIYDLF